MKREIKGSFTVEAVIMIPFLIVISMVMVYFSIYIYDRTLMVQDVNELIAVARNEEDQNSIEAACKSFLVTIKAEHPYISMDNLQLNISKNGSENTFKLSGDWKLPVYSKFNTTISYEKKVFIQSPVDVMFKTESIRNLFKGD